MTSVNLGETLKYLKTWESLGSENLTEYYLLICVKIYFHMFFATLKDVIETQIKTNHSIT